jgi:hypothetical protein
MIIFRIEGIYRNESLKASTFKEAKSIALAMLAEWDASCVGEYVKVFKVSKPNVSTSQHDQIVQEWSFEKV